MTSVITVVILAVAPIVGCYLAWWYQFGRGGSTDAQHPARNGQGGQTMPGVLAAPERARVTRWVEDSRAVFERARRALDEYDQRKTAADAAQKEREHLQQTRAALRAEVRRVCAEIERLQNERAESTRWCATMMQEAAARLRIGHPPA